MKQIITALSMVPLLLIGCDDEPTEALEEPMLPYAEAIAEETAEAAEEPPETEGAPGVRIEIPAQVKAAVSVTPFTPEIECPGTLVTFDEHSAELDEEAEAILDAFAACVNETQEAEALTVQTELDPVPVEDFNETLAAQRAVAVVTYLTDQDVDETNFGVVAVGLEGTSDMPRLYPRTDLAK
jgi:outer membrane protein OmpA-like peptidoglycan-associated protein